MTIKEIREELDRLCEQSGVNENTEVIIDIEGLLRTIDKGSLYTYIDPRG